MTEQTEDKKEAETKRAVHTYPLIRVSSKLHNKLNLNNFSR